MCPISCICHLVSLYHWGHSAPLPARSGLKQQNIVEVLYIIEKEDSFSRESQTGWEAWQAWRERAGPLGSQRQNRDLGELSVMLQSLEDAGHREVVLEELAENLQGLKDVADGTRDLGTRRGPWGSQRYRDAKRPWLGTRRSALRGTQGEPLRRNSKMLQQVAPLLLLPQPGEHKNSL